MFSRLVVFLIVVSAFGGALAFRAKIVGGIQAEPGFAPFAVSMRTGLVIKSHFCGGSLVTAKFVITAAHCVDAVYSKGLSSSIRIVAGTNTLHVGGISKSVRRNFTHPGWNRNEDIKNDLGLFELESAYSLSDLVQSIPLNKKVIGNNIPLTVVGWGAKSLGGGTSSFLLYLNTFSLGHKECLKLRDDNVQLYPGGVAPYISEFEICTYLSVGNATCNGDSGGALYNDDGLVGIVSWGLPCAKGAPDVFTRISAYVDWIEPIISA